MSIDINNQQLPNGNITYWYWCERCQMSHDTPWCPNWDYDSPFRDASNPSPLLPHVCPHCGQVMWK